MTEWRGCFFCARNLFDGACTDAFPDGMPFGIASGDVDHTVPVEGDH